MAIKSFQVSVPTDGTVTEIVSAGNRSCTVNVSVPVNGSELVWGGPDVTLTTGVGLPGPSMTLYPGDTLYAVNNGHGGVITVDVFITGLVN